MSLDESKYNLDNLEGISILSKKDYSMRTEEYTPETAPSNNTSTSMNKLALPFIMKMVGNVSIPLRQVTGTLTITFSTVEFKNILPIGGGNFKVPVNQIAAVSRVTYAIINPSAMEIRLKDGKKYTLLLSAWEKEKAQRVVDLVNSLL